MILLVLVCTGLYETYTGFYNIIRRKEQNKMKRQHPFETILNQKDKR